MEPQDLQKLEKEVSVLEDERRGIEHRLKTLEMRGKPGQFRHPKDRDVKGGAKRFRDGGRGQENFERQETHQDIQEEDDQNKKTRLSSVVSNAGRNTNFRDRRPPQRANSKESNDDEDTEVVKPKLSSTIVPASEKKPNRDLVQTDEQKQRTKKLLGSLLVGTLTKFKKDLSVKTDAAQRREEIEQKITEKVKKEQEQSLAQQKEEIESQRSKEIAAKEKILKQLEEKEALLNSLKFQKYHEQLSKFQKTTAKPHIYFKPKDLTEKQDKPAATKEDEKKEAKETTSDTTTTEGEKKEDKKNEEGEKMAEESITSIEPPKEDDAPKTEEIPATDN